MAKVTGRTMLFELHVRAQECRMTAPPHHTRAKPGAGRRADAQRNIESILDAAVARLALDPEASVADIAKTAGVGRVTLYGHFGTRADLIDAVMTRTMERADAVL